MEKEEGSPEAGSASGSVGHEGDVRYWRTASLSKDEQDDTAAAAAGGYDVA